MTEPATLTLDRCPACHATGGEEFAVGPADLRRCAACGAVYAQRYADPDAVYVDGYYSGASAFGIDVSHPRFQAFLAEINVQRAELIERFVTRGSVLDVGCGTGDTLIALRERGWQVQGVDPMEESGRIARSRGLEVVTAMLEDSGLPERSYDVVSAFHVLEHVPDGPAFLSLLARWAKPGGHVVVESPNWDSHLRTVSGERWIHLRPLEHLVHYAPATVQRAFTTAGLEPVAALTRTWASRLQTPTEALADLGRFGWARLPAPLARAAAAAARRADARRGSGMVVVGIARVPEAES